MRVSERQKLDALTRIRNGATGGGTLVFVRTKTGARDFPNGSMPVATPLNRGTLYDQAPTEPARPRYERDGNVEMTRFSSTHVVTTAMRSTDL